MLGFMPLCSIYTSAEPSSAESGRALLTELSERLAGHLGKPESYVMTCLISRPTMTFAGTFEPACYVEIKNVGTMSPELTRKISADFCDRLSEALGVPRNRIYIEFSDAKPHLWGYDGTTFG
jgi:phenylpyruvate tautomerase PptA (4-oxalocrotonate tautomerase family)